MLLEFRLDALMPHLGGVIEYMLHASQDADESVALEACEFWSAYCENKDAPPAILAEYLPRLVPALLGAFACCYFFFCMLHFGLLHG